MELIEENAVAENENSDESYSHFREYFEVGCLCIINNKITKQLSLNDKDAVDYYWDNCKCSRHPESYIRGYSE